MFNNMSLQARILSAFMFMGLLVLIIALVGWSATTRLSHDLNTIGGNYLPSIVNLWEVKDGQNAVRAGERLLLLTRASSQARQNGLTKMQDALNQIDQGWQAYQKLPRESEEDKIYQTVQPLWKDWQKSHEEFLSIYQDFARYNILNPDKVVEDLLRQGKTNSPELQQAQLANEVLDRLNQQRENVVVPAFEKASNALQELLAYNQKGGLGAVEAGNRDISQSNLWILVGVIIGPITAVVMGIYFSNTIAKPLGAKIAGVVGVAQKISTGDLTTPVQTTENVDEVGQLQNAFYTMSQNLNNLIYQVQRSGVQITTSATQIAASGKQLEATVTEQVASTNEVTATGKEIAATSEHLVRTMDEVERASEQTARAATEGQTDLMQMETTMRTLADSTVTISGKLGMISEKAQNINTIIITITKVADQTNLLSLNAAIEAEKAGEYGRGFAVVAREIRRLADQTAVATLDIESMVKEMQGAVSTGVTEMDKFTKQVERGVEDVRKISTKLESIISQVQALNPRFEQVSQGMESQSEGAQQISEAMVQLSEAASQTALTLREINGAIQQLNDAAHTLRQEISHFKIADNSSLQRS